MTVVHRIVSLMRGIKPHTCSEFLPSFFFFWRIYSRYFYIDFVSAPTAFLRFLYVEFILLCVKKGCAAATAAVAMLARD